MGEEEAADTAVWQTDRQGRQTDREAEQPTASCGFTTTACKAAGSEKHGQLCSFLLSNRRPSVTSRTRYYFVFQYSAEKALACPGAQGAP